MPLELKEKLKNPDSKINFSIRVGDYEFLLEGKGHPELILSHTEDIVIRKSDFICPRTLAIKCDKASDLLPREMVTLLQNPKIKGILSINID